MAIFKKDTTEKKATKPAGTTKKTATATVTKKHTPAIEAKRVLLGAHVSEKAAGTEEAGIYTFRVVSDATKIDVKRAIATKYGVVPTDVRMMNIEGKRTRFGRTEGKRRDWKKAIVTLPKGSHIDIHSGV